MHTHGIKVFDIYTHFKYLSASLKVRLHHVKFRKEIVKH